MLNDTYMGWRITADKRRPVTGTWSAVKFGVGLCAGTYDALVAMIAAKEKEMAKPFPWRSV